MRKQKFIAVILMVALIVTMLPVNLIPGSGNDGNVQAATLTQFQQAVQTVAAQSKGKTRGQLGLPADEWCGYYADYVLKNALKNCGYSNYSDYYSSVDMPSATAIAQTVTNDTRWAEYFSWRNWTATPSGRTGTKSSNRSSYYPQVGDIVTVNWNSSSYVSPEHVALIIKVNSDGSFVTSEGNTMRSTYSRDTSPVAEYTYTKDYVRDGEPVYGRSGGNVVCIVRPYDPTKTSTPTIPGTRYIVNSNFYAYIIAKKTWKHLESVPPTSDMDRRNVTICKDGNKIYSAAQIWEFQPQGDGSYIIRSMYDDRVLEVYGGGTAVGANVCTAWLSQNYTHRWYLYQQ